MTVFDRHAVFLLCSSQDGISEPFVCIAEAFVAVFPFERLSVMVPTRLMSAPVSIKAFKGLWLPSKKYVTIFLNCVFGFVDKWLRDIKFSLFSEPLYSFVAMADLVSCSSSKLCGERVP
jgi:hypothetical protein